MQKIWTIQYLRALAALAVLVHHLSYDNGDWFPVGSFGVDIFFVISGFIMLVMTATRGRGVSKFAVDRIARIVPTYWCVTILSAVGALVLARPWIFGIYHPLNVKMFVYSLLFIPQATQSVVPQGWTLNVEMFFYALFAATLFLPRAFQILALSAILSSFVVFGLVMNMSGGTETIYVYFNPRLLEFVGGLVIGELWLRNKLSSRIFGVGATLSGFLAAQLATMTPIWHSGIWIAASVMIVAGVLTCENQFKLPKIGPLASVGDASYIIYLIHTPIVMLAKLQHWLAIPGQIVIATTICVTAALIALPLERWIVRYTRERLNRVWKLFLFILRAREDSVRP
jgi:exopolysaccharide production protein ExoZ